MTKEDTTQHPAYGFIRLSRTDGGNGCLFMSPLRHEHRITIVIGEAEQVRSNNVDRHFPRKQLIEIDMSEAQFAQFVCNSSFSEGAPCTIRRKFGEGVAPIEEVQLKSDRYYKEARQTATEALEALREARERIAALTAKLPKSAQGEIAKELAALEMKIGDHLPWIVQQHHEHMDKVANLAKLEIEAHLIRAAERVGLNEAEKLPMLESGPRNA